MTTENDSVIGEFRQNLILRRLAPGTISEYVRSTRRLGEWLDTQYGVPLLTAERDHLRAWRATLTGADATILAYMSHARSFYHWAGAEDLIAWDPTLGIPLPRQPTRMPRPIAEARLEHAIDQAIDRVRVWLVLAGYAGLRACEIASLHRSRLYENAPDPYMIVIGKGGKERAVPISPYVWAEMLAYGLPRHGFLYLRCDGTGPITGPLVSKACNKHLRRLGLDETLHQGRHRFGTETQRATGDIRVTQDLMGHASPKTTAGYAAPSNPATVGAVLAVQPKRGGLRPAG